MNLKMAVGKVSPEGVAHAFGAWLVRTYGADKASTLADTVVGSVQRMSRATPEQETGEPRPHLETRL